MRRYAISVDNAVIPGGSYTSVINVRCKGSEPNAVLHVADVVDAIGRPLRQHEEDWLDLLRAIHTADLVCERGQNEEWNRHITLALPLREPSRFEPLRPLLQEIFGRMTHDSLEILLERDPMPPAERYPTRRDQPQFDSVALLSGGIDSSAGAAQLLAAGARPCFLASNTSPHVTRAQTAVKAALVNRYGDGPHLARFRVNLSHKHPQAPLPRSDLSQRSRTLLFAGVAATVAAARGIETVHLAENGVMAINCPLTPGRVGGFSTHTAHPDVLAQMGRLFSQVLDRPIRVENPLLPKTKAEVVGDLMQANLADLVPQTHSCWIARQAAHCGHCVPCIVRRLSVEAAGAPDAHYDLDVLNSPPPRDDPKFANIGDYLMFAATFADSSDDDLLFDFTELNVEGGFAAIDPILATHRRWAASVRQVINAHPALARLL